MARARIAAIAGLVVAGIIWVTVVVKAEPFAWGAIGTGHDARPYWEAAMRAPYARAVVGAWDAYLYSPAFLQVIAPLRSLPWPSFLAGWQAILLVATAILSGPVLLGPVVALVAPELWGGNITLLIALAVVAGFRWPATWSFVLLTKVTPGIGLIWFAVRREWWALATALGATLAVVAISTAVAPGLWRDWFGILLANTGRPITSGSIPIPFAVRLPIAILLLAWGARTDRRWVVPVACLLALPVIWYGSLSLLVGVIPLVAPALARRWPILGVGWRHLLGDRSAVPVRTGTGSSA
jgi:Glycosyltransferase family 87